MGLYCMRIGQKVWCMEFSEYRTLGWDMERAKTAESLFPNRNLDGIEDTDVLIANRIKREIN